MKKLVLHLIVPVLIIASGVVTARYLKSQARQAKQRPPEETAPLVEVAQVAPSRMEPSVTATGTTVPARRVTLAPEVSGRIVTVSKQLVPGNRVKKGQILARLDQRDYTLAIQQEISRVEQAALEVELESGRRAIATEELKLLGKRSEDVSALATREPHLQVAEQQKTAAESSLERARLNLSRTVLRAPFNAVILEKHVDKGQLVGPSTPVATLIGADELWVDVSIPVEQLPAIRIPGINAEEGSAATVVHQIGPETRVVRKGEVLRLQGQLDLQSRTAQLLVSVPDPFHEEGLPLLAGAFVSVEIEGQHITEGFDLPREALRDGRFVWIVGASSHLEKRAVTVAWRTRERVVVTGGLSAGEWVVVGPIVDPIDGMRVSPMNKEAGPAQGAS